MILKKRSPSGLLLVVALWIGMPGNEARQLNLEDELMVKAIAQDTERIAEGKPLTPYYAKHAQEQVCFEELGCFSKIDGPFAFIDVDPQSPEELKNRFLLYSRHNKNNGFELSYLDKSTITTGFFDPEKPLVIICHGFNEDVNKAWVQRMKDLFLEREDCIVLAVDWGRGARLPFYGQGVVNSEVAARQLTRILYLLHKERSLVIENIHAVGFSLGAHLLGLVGKNLRKDLNAQMGRISGLDPAGPSFENKNDTVHLSTKDAKFVDIVHTSSGTSIIFGDLGIVKPIGHQDYYPNGGKDQPGCWIFSVVCSHNRAVELFVESLELELKDGCQFKGYPCAGGYKDYKEGKCPVCGESGCGLLGIKSVQEQGGGSLYLKTNGATPYCASS